ncbi:MAG: hypothetical protein RR162_05940 [Oscillospiraceae bacterium]
MFELYKIISAIRGVSTVDLLTENEAFVISVYTDAIAQKQSPAEIQELTEGIYSAPVIPPLVSSSIEDEMANQIAMNVRIGDETVGLTYQAYIRLLEQM